MSTSHSDPTCVDDKQVSTCPGDELSNGAVNGIADHPRDRTPIPEDSHQLILEKIERLNLENYELKLSSDELKSKITQLEQSCQSFKAKAERASSQVESTKNELQSMVIKYATSEKEVLNLKKHYGDSDRKLKELLKERDSLQAKIKELNGEKKVLLSNVERHILETATLQNENEILKNKLEQTNVKIQQLQLSLSQVQSKYHSAKVKLERIEIGFNQLSGFSKDNKCELGETTTSNDANSNEPAENEQNHNCESEDNINWTDQYLSCIEANKSLNREVKQLEVEREQYRNTVEELNQKLNDANERVKDYMRKVDLIDSLKNEMLNKQKTIEELKEKFDKINDINRELIGDIESSKLKESELLEYTERMTAKMVSLQSEHNSLAEKLKIAEEECQRQQDNFNRVSSERDKLQLEFESHKQSCEIDSSKLKSELDDKVHQCESLQKKVEELENEIKILNRKLFLNFKELNKEIRTLKQQNEQLLERASQPGGLTAQTNHVETTSTLSSRTNSLNSLSENDSEKKLDGHNSTQHSSSETSSSDYELITSLNDIDKNVLIERILRLQRTLIKRNEKIDFLEEHNQHLMEEVKKKCKLLQYYILKEETGALATESMDKNKAYLSKRGGGIMSSLYNSSLTDDTMTLERSLEINNKLHAVLEDTLLKNMTLKENLNTLAMEIERLSKQKR